MSYDSPIHLFELSNPGEEIIRQVTKAIEDEKTTYVYEYVGRLGIDVDKEELLRALKYDRDQYKQGHFVRVLAWMMLPDLYKDPLDELKRKIDDFNKEEKV